MKKELWPNYAKESPQEIKNFLVVTLDLVCGHAFGNRTTLWHPLTINHYRQVKNVADIYRWNALGMLTDEHVEHYWMHHSMESFKASLRFAIRLAERLSGQSLELHDLKCWCQTGKEPRGKSQAHLN